MQKYLIGLAGLAALAAAGYAFAQGIMPLPSPTGTEQVTVYPSSPTNPNDGGSQATVTLNTIRNTTGYQISSATSGTLVMTSATDNLILTGGGAAVTVDLPPSPPDGELFAVVNGATVTTGTITLATTDSSTIVNYTAAALATGGASVELQYTAASKIWYRVR